MVPHDHVQGSGEAPSWDVLRVLLYLDPLPVDELTLLLDEREVSPVVVERGRGVREQDKIIYDDGSLISPVAASGVAADEGSRVFELLLYVFHDGEAGLALEGAKEELGADLRGAGDGAAEGRELPNLVDLELPHPVLLRETIELQEIFCHIAISINGHLWVDLLDEVPDGGSQDVLQQVEILQYVSM